VQNVLSVNFLESALVNKELPHLLGRPGAVVGAPSKRNFSNARIPPFAIFRTILEMEVC
jgi:hypothetical protein